MKYYQLMKYYQACIQARSQDCQNEEADRSSAPSPPSPPSHPLRSRPP